MGVWRDTGAQLLALQWLAGPVVNRAKDCMRTRACSVSTPPSFSSWSAIICFTATSRPPTMPWNPLNWV